MAQLGGRLRALSLRLGLVGRLRPAQEQPVQRHLALAKEALPPDGDHDDEDHREDDRAEAVEQRRVLDPAELEFPFEKPATFVDMESGRDLYVDPASARAQYRANFDKHAERIARTCRDLGIDLYTLPTSQPMELALFDFLQARVRAGRQVVRAGNRAARS